jgi:hypothetical protein
MKYLVLVVALFFGYLESVAQRTQAAVDAEQFECRYFGYEKLKRPQEICNFLRFTSNQHAEEVVDNILKQVGLARNFVVVECPNTENCFATVVEGQRYIVYDGAFMKRVENLTQTDWSAISIVAHEIGHHLQGHTIDGRGSRPQKELEADRFSGFVLHQLGASLDESLVAIQALGDEKPSFSHPAKAARVEAIKQAWQDAEAMYPKWNKGQPVANSPQKAPRNTPQIPASKPAATPQNDDNSVGCVAGNCDNGLGIYINEETRERYEGDFRYGKRHGTGVQYYPDGSMKYKGDFKNDLRAGYGAYYFANGDKLVGQFVQNAPNGKGTYYYADGDRFVGIYEDGKRNGPGNYYYRDGRREAGIYEDDELVR